MDAIYVNASLTPGNNLYKLYQRVMGNPATIFSCTIKPKHHQSW